MNPKVLVAAVAVGAMVLGMGAWGMSWYNSAVAMENGLQAHYKDNQNRYDAFWKQVKEVAQVTDRYKEDFRAALTEALSATNDAAGQEAMMTVLQKAVPGLPPETYTRLQTVIEVGRRDFKQAQTGLLDRQRSYRTHLETFPGVALAGLSGMPRTLAGDVAPPRDTDGDGRLTVLDYPTLVSSRTREVFEKGEDEPIQVFDK